MCPSRRVSPRPEFETEMDNDLSSGPVLSSLYRAIAQVTSGEFELKKSVSEPFVNELGSNSDFKEKVPKTAFAEWTLYIDCLP